MLLAGTGPGRPAQDAGQFGTHTAPAREPTTPQGCAREQETRGSRVGYYRIPIGRSAPGFDSLQVQ